MKMFKIAMPAILFLYALATLTSMAGMEIFGWLAFLMTLGLIYFDPKKEWLKRPVLETTDKVLLALFGVIAVSAALTVAPEPDRLFIIGNGRFIFLFLMVRIGLEFLPAAQIAKGVKILLPIVGVIAIYSIWQYFTGIDLIRGARSTIQTYDGKVFRTGGMWGTPMTFAHSMALTFCFPAAIALIGVPERPWVRRLAMLVALLAGVSILCSYTRGAWIGVSVAIFVMALYVGRKVAIGMTVALVVGASALLTFSPQIRDRFTSITSSTKSSNTVRLDVWKANIEMFKDHPIIGVGYGVNEDILASYFKKMGIEQEFNGHAHNNLLQFLSGTGILGFGLFLAFIILFFVMAHKLLRRLPAGPSWPRVFVLASMGGMIALHIGGLTECNFKDAEVNHQFMLILALLTVMWRKYGGAQTKNESTAAT